MRTGHEVTIGSRTEANEAAAGWAAHMGPAAAHGTFADAAAAAAEVVVNCTLGAASLTALSAAGANNLAGKVLVDVANPLDFSIGMPPTLFVSNTDSLGERIQAAFPDARVVKTLNTITTDVMVEPGLVSGDHAVFVSGNDADAKTVVRELLGGLGWPEDRILDLGDITNARATEMYLPLWLSLMGAIGTARFNIAIVC